VIISKQNRYLTVSEINESLPEPLHVSTVKRRINAANLFGIIFIQNKRKYLQWARKHQHWKIQQWEKFSGPINPNS
jgi:hypothetical protein